MGFDEVAKGLESSSVGDRDAYLIFHLKSLDEGCIRCKDTFDRSDVAMLRYFRIRLVADDGHGFIRYGCGTGVVLCCRSRQSGDVLRRLRGKGGCHGPKGFSVFRALCTALLVHLHDGCCLHDSVGASAACLHASAGASAA